MGIAFDELWESANEFAIFGSFGLVKKASDIDIFTVSNIASEIGKELDLICLDEEAVLKAEWLESELANHIAMYGTWLKGEPTWVNKVAITSNTVLSKRKRIVSYLAGLHRSWKRLSPPFQHKHSVLLRRQLQRLEMLRSGQSTPPTFILDEAWEQDSRKNDRMSSQISILGIDEGLLEFCFDVLEANCAAPRNTVDNSRRRQKGSTSTD